MKVQEKITVRSEGCSLHVVALLDSIVNWMRSSQMRSDFVLMLIDNNNNYTININTKSDLICEDLIQSNLKLIHSHIVSNHLSQRPPNKVLQDQTPSVSPAELLLSRETRRTLAQLRTNKSPLLVSYLFSIGDPRHPSPLCPLCLMHDHTSSHLFECKSLPTSLSSLDLWTNPDKVEPFLATWGERLLAATWFRVLDSAGSTLVEWGRQQQQQDNCPQKNGKSMWMIYGKCLDWKIEHNGMV